MLVKQNIEKFKQSLETKGSQSQKKKDTKRPN